jgi:CRISPR system Cascade subunit CasC
MTTAPTTAPATPTGSVFADLHVLQPVPASNLNRDEDQEPKTITLGGVTRGFASTASWKRPLRLRLEEDLDEPTARTRMLPLVVADALRALDWPQDLADFTAAQIALSAKKGGGLKTNPKEGHRTQAMLHLPTAVPAHLVQLCLDHREQLSHAHIAHLDTGKPAAAVLPTAAVAAELTRSSLSIALFGRMLAELPAGHVEGAVQIAPPFTVHESHHQPDFFTAVEDWSRPGEAGSAHLQTQFLTTGVFYRYATVNVTALVQNLGGDTATAGRLLELFAWWFLLVMPRGKQNATAPHTVPHLAAYSIRRSRPVSYAAAFEQPVRAAGRGYAAPATQALADYAATIDRLIGTGRRIAYGHTTAAGTAIDALGRHHDGFADLSTALSTAATAALPTKEARP